MKRKINLVGKGTLTVSLPSSWVKINNLKKGDDIEITENYNDLIISNKKKGEKKEIVVDARNIKEEYFSRRLFLIPYIRGYHKIKILFNQPWFFKKIEENKDLTPGFEIMEQGEDYCVLESIVNLDEEEFDKVYNRLYDLILNINQLYINALEKDYNHLYKSIIQAERVTNTLDIFCRRLLNTGHFKDKEKLTSMYMLVHNLEGISDIYRDMAKKSLGYKFKKKEVFLKDLESLREMLEIIRKINKDNYSEEILHFKNILVRIEKFNDEKILILNSKEADIFGHFRIIVRYIHGMSEEGVYF